MPAHSTASTGHGRWAWLVALAALAALVVVVRPAVGHGEQSGTGTPEAAPRSVPTTSAPGPSPAPARSATPRPSGPAPSTPARTTPASTTSAEIPAAASGRLAVVPGKVAAAGPGSTLSYRLEIEADLPVDGAAVAAQVHEVLTDPRGWQPIEGVAFARTDGPAAFELIIASPALTDRLCYPLDTIGQLSCRNGDRVILNARRWATAVPWYAGHMDEYRAYLVNHEVGHRLGHGHAPCHAAGAPAPVMMQQSKGIGACRRNPWPSVASD